MKRYHDEQHIIEREFRERLRIVGCDDGKFQTQRGRYRKRKSIACGRARCHLCHGQKLMGIPTHKQVVADRSFREQLQEAE